MTRHQSSRQGSVLVCVIACMIVVTAIAATSIQATLRTRRETKVELQVMQAELLCQAGISRARTQLESNSDYDGERWAPSMDAGERQRATIDITVSHTSESGREVLVNASLNSNDSLLPTIRRSYRFEIKNLQNRANN
jgi:type II secretory pathway component PulK